MSKVEIFISVLLGGLGIVALFAKFSKTKPQEREEGDIFDEREVFRHDSNPRVVHDNQKNGHDKHKKSA